MPRLSMSCLMAPALLALVASTSLRSTPASAQGFWEAWPPFGASDSYAKRKRQQAEQDYGAQGRRGVGVRTYPSAAAARASATRTARLSRLDPDDDDDDSFQKLEKPQGPKVLEGGPRPDIDPISPKPVSIGLGQPSGTIVIDTRGRQLFLVTGKESALRYPISVGRDGFTWTGTEKIARIADWPDWHPPQEMRERIPTLPEKMTGGIRNPLGAKSLYLGNSLYRIHGTNDARTIGQAASSGCFRMLNGHVVDLGSRVGVGTKVVVVSHIGAPVAKTAAPASTPGSKPQAQARPRNTAG